MEQIITETIVPIMPYVVVIVAALAIVAPLVMALVNRQISIKMLAGVGLLVLILGGIYMTSSGEISETFQTSKYADVDAGLMQFVQACITSTMVLLVIAIASWVILEIVNFIKGLI